MSEEDIDADLSNRIDKANEYVNRQDKEEDLKKSIWYVFADTKETIPFGVNEKLCIKDIVCLNKLLEQTRDLS